MNDRHLFSFTKGNLPKTLNVRILDMIFQFWEAYGPSQNCCPHTYKCTCKYQTCVNMRVMCLLRPNHLSFMLTPKVGQLVVRTRTATTHVTMASVAHWKINPSSLLYLLPKNSTWFLSTIWPASTLSIPPHECDASRGKGVTWTTSKLIWIWWWDDMWKNRWSNADHHQSLYASHVCVATAHRPKKGTMRRRQRLQSHQQYDKRPQQGDKNPNILVPIEHGTKCEYFYLNYQFLHS